VKVERVSSGPGAANAGRTSLPIRSKVVTQQPPPDAAVATQESLFIEPGIIRIFGKGDIARRGQISGWAEPEDGHTWNEGIETSVLLEAQQPTGPVTIAVEGMPYITGTAKKQDVTLYANGYRVGFWRLTSQEHLTITATIEPEQWFARDGKATLRLVWHLPDCVSPKELGEGIDGRRLAFAFCTITLFDR
jgi:hypothetical protein